MPLSIENLEESDEDSCDIEENFSTKQLFSFAWQIAKGMVIIIYVLRNTHQKAMS